MDIVLAKMLNSKSPVEGSIGLLECLAKNCSYFCVAGLSLHNGARTMIEKLKEELAALNIIAVAWAIGV